MTTRTHMVLQGKGGVGKSFCAATLAQWLLRDDRNPVCIDTDPVNGTFSGYKALNVKRLEIMEGDEINSRRFDDLIELIASATSDVIVDNGASSFVPLSHYMLSNQVPALLRQMERPLVIHTVITGGQALLDTMNGFSQLVRQFTTDTTFVVWLNPFWGAVTYEGKDFEAMKAYTANRDRVEAIIRVPVLKAETYGTDLSNMLKQRLTFEEAIGATNRTIMERQRLKIIERGLYEQLSAAATL
jgi:hypothetical protein